MKPFNNLEMCLFGGASIIEGLVIIISLGFCKPHFALWVAKKIARFEME